MILNWWWTNMFFRQFHSFLLIVYHRGIQFLFRVRIRIFIRSRNFPSIMINPIKLKAISQSPIRWLHRLHYYHLRLKYREQYNNDMRKASIRLLRWNYFWSGFKHDNLYWISVKWIYRRFSREGHDCIGCWLWTGTPGTEASWKIVF